MSMQIRTAWGTSTRPAAKISAGAMITPRRLASAVKSAARQRSGNVSQIWWQPGVAEMHCPGNLFRASARLATASARRESSMRSAVPSSIQLMAGSAVSGGAIQADTPTIEVWRSKSSSGECRKPMLKPGAAVSERLVR